MQAINGNLQEVLDIIKDEVQNYNQTEVSIEAGMSHGAVNHWVRERNSALPENLAEVADILGFTIQIFE